jgi:hypothetical protein
MFMSSWEPSVRVVPSPSEFSSLVVRPDFVVMCGNDPDPSLIGEAKKSLSPRGLGQALAYCDSQLIQSERRSLYCLFSDGVMYRLFLVHRGGMAELANSLLWQQNSEHVLQNLIALIWACLEVV